MVKDIETFIPKEILDTIVSTYKDLDQIRPTIIKEILYFRFLENAQQGGKLQRLSETRLIQKY